MLFVHVTPVMAHIINASMRTNYVPIRCKVGKHTIIFKEGEIRVNNFRHTTVCNGLIESPRRGLPLLRTEKGIGIYDIK